MSATTPKGGVAASIPNGLPGMEPYLAASRFIDCDHAAVTTQAADLAMGLSDPCAIAQQCFVFVRDAIQHSWDAQRNPVTCRASEVLLHKTGYCYAKSHLLAALLRANHIPAGLCYQRLSLHDGGPPYCLHGLNAVFLPEFGWYRIDARGNKPGVEAAFCPPREALAFPLHEAGEMDLPEIWPEPLPLVTRVLERCTDIAEVYANLPDIHLFVTASIPYREFSRHHLTA